MRGCALAITLAVVGCGPGHGEHGDGGITCTTGLAVTVQKPDQTFAPLGAGGVVDADLVLGFQGFKYIYVRARLAPPPPETLLTSAEITLAGGAPRALPLGYLHPEDSEPAQLRLFFNDEALPALVDAHATIVLRAGEGACTASAAGEVVLRYRAGCVEDPDGTRVCSDGGMP